MGDGLGSRLSVLWGEDHQVYGDIAVRPVGDRVAVALSRGRHPKGYPSVDANEDAVLAATNGRRSVLAVADGHRGFDAARAAIGAVRDGIPTMLDPKIEASRAVDVVLSRAAKDISDALAGVDGSRASSRTTLVVAVVDGSDVTGASFGDSAAVVVGRSGARMLSAVTEFLGPGSDMGDARSFNGTLRPGSWLILGSDGLFDFLGRDWALRLRPLIEDARPEALSRAAIEAAFDGGAGDNVAVAALVRD